MVAGLSKSNEINGGTFKAAVLVHYLLKQSTCESSEDFENVANFHINL